MQRIKEQFLDKLESVITLQGKTILEIGCGNGERSEEIAERCRSLVGIDPSETNINAAQKRGIANVVFEDGRAEQLHFSDNVFDLVIFTLSLHHVPPLLMPQAISEAVRVVHREGFIIFLEPGTQGSFFEAEIQFNAGDGDEREAKTTAYQSMREHPQMKLVREFTDETIFQFDSREDFMVNMIPKQNLNALGLFLGKLAYRLHASRRINIFQPQ